MPVPFAPLVLLALAAPPAPPGPELAVRVAELVRGLGNDDFDRREAAQKGLVGHGPAALPALEALDARGAIADPEVAYRVREVRRAVGGPVEALREVLVAHALLPHGEEDRWDVGPVALKRIADHQPATGDFLLALASEPKHPLHRPAVNAFVQAWDAMGPDQVRAYLERALLFDVQHRPAYPRGIDAAFEFGYRFRHGYGSRPPEERFRLVAIATHVLDGKPYGEPYRYSHYSSGCTTGWVRTGNLAVGRHAFSATLAFEAAHAGKPVRGSIASGPHAFEVLPAGAPDDLAGPTEAAMEERVRATLRIAETEAPGNPDLPFQFRGQAATDWWRPQTTWTARDGKPHGLHLPIWRLEAALPVDLAFGVFLRVEGTRDEYDAGELVVLAGTTKSLGYFIVRDVESLAKGRSGFVPVRVVLRPSRAVALTVPEVTRYFPGEIVGEVMRMKVGPAEAPPLSK